VNERDEMASGPTEGSKRIGSSASELVSSANRTLDKHNVAQRATPPSQPPSIPDYELLRRIGGGSYGEVWLARSATAVLRAVKIVRRHTFEDNRPFQREMDAIDAFQNASTFGGEDNEKVTQMFNELRHAFRENGEPGYWLKRLEQAEAELSPEKQPYAFAKLHARLGDNDRALALLRNAWQVKDTGLVSLISDQCWDDLRDDDQFKELLKKLGYRTDWPIK